MLIILVTRCTNNNNWCKIIKYEYKLQINTYLVIMGWVLFILNPWGVNKSMLLKSVQKIHCYRILTCLMIYRIKVKIDTRFVIILNHLHSSLPWVSESVVTLLVVALLISIHVLWGSVVYKNFARKYFMKKQFFSNSKEFYDAWPPDGLTPQNSLCVIVRLRRFW